MTGKAPAVILILLATSLVLSVGCDSETERENPTPSGTEDAPLSKESAIQQALAGIAANPENKADPSTAKADLMTEREAYETIRLRGGLEGGPSRTLSDRLVWLVEVRGKFVGFRAYGLTPGLGTQAATLLVIVTMDGRMISGAYVP